MTVERLGPAATLISALRTQMTRKRDEVARGAGARDSASARAAASRDVAALRRELGEIAAQADPDDEASMERARPRVVRAMLLWEFGPGLRDYGEWQPMLDSIVQTLESDEGQRRALAELILELRRG
ncbi:hypothetical protein [Lysobacter enzymogenes]|uniref:Uncharacterized protein n=1 Tax=Lysobacter enzymogenes TaxID=69 RepID=A0AAU9AJA7_LYSEN|nr:hypothetical protein [Lysobacter enzymogenes]BAV96903.1 hypothetical protein LEN_1416 [Lysobacter enzymogenes]